jgi:RNA polymerase sigma factor (sigma-70 family)
MRTSIDARELLANTRWIRRLAGHLTQDPDAADDLAQETWLAALGSRRPAEVAPVTWLGAIVRNLRRMRVRSETRRGAREDAASTEAALATAPADPAATLERLELQQLLGQLVLELSEPYRSTVVLRYYDGLDAGEIARRMGVPGGTVRWRLKQGLDTIRTRLDARCGCREIWLPLLAPLATAKAARPGGAPGPGRQTLAKMALVALGLALLGGAAVLVRGLVLRSPAPPRGREQRAASRSTSGEQAVHAQRAASAIAAFPARAGSVGPEPEPPGAAAEERALVRRAQVPLGAAPLAGPATAKVTILLLGDYECPYSAQAHATLEQLRALRPADVRVQFVQAPLRAAAHPNAILAARASHAAAEQGKYWEMHQLLLANPDLIMRDPQGEIVRGPKGVMRRPGLERADLEAAAAKLGLDLGRFRADLEGAAVEQKLAIDRATVESVGEVAAIPVLFINGRRFERSLPLEVVDGLVSEEIQAADRLLARGVPPAALYNELVASGTGAPATSEDRLPPQKLAARAPRSPGDIVRRMLAAVVSGDHDAFVADATDHFWSTSTPELMSRLEIDVGKRLRGGFEVQALGSLHREDGSTVFLFKLEFRDRGEDRLVRLVLQDGHVAGFLD